MNARSMTNRDFENDAILQVVITSSFHLPLLLLLSLIEFSYYRNIAVIVGRAGYLVSECDHRGRV